MTELENSDLVRNTLAVVFIAILISASCYILLPFLTALVWATMIVVTTWPLMLAVQKRLGGRRGAAVAVMTVALLLLLVVPLTAAILTIVERSDDIVTWTKSLSSFTLPQLPGWVEKLPLVGPKIAERWHYFATISRDELNAQLVPYVKRAAGWMMSQAGNIMVMIGQFLLTVIVSAVLYTTGEKGADGICRFARRLGGQHGEDAAILAARAIRGVALGVVVTAVIQTTLAAIGLVVSGVPAAALLSAVILILCIAQVGPGLVLIPAVVWLFWSGENLWGTLMIFWTVFCGTIDNVIRPVLIKKGADLPLLLIFAGVIGGLFAFGVIGLFIGPVMLAVTYTLLQAWVRRKVPGQEELQPEDSLTD